MSISEKPLIALSSAFLYRRSLETNLRLVKDSGFEHTELFLTRNVASRPLEEIKQAVDASGLSVASIHLPIPFSYNEYWPNLEESIRKGIEWAGIFNAEWVISHPLVVMADADEELHRAVKDRYRRILAKSAEIDGAADCVLIENMPNLATGRPIHNLFKYPDEFLQTVAESGFGMAFDTTHWGTFDRDTIAGYRYFAALVRNVHVSDLLGRTEHIVPGDGDLDLDAFLGELNATGYSGQVTLELDFTTRGRNEGRDEDGILQVLIKSREWMERAFE